MQAQLRACVFAVVDGHEGNATGGVLSCKAAATDPLFVLGGKTCSELNPADLEQRASNAHSAKVASTLEGDRRSCLFLHSA